MPEHPNVETVVRTLLSPTDRKRVELYLRLVGRLEEITTAAEELHEAFEAVLSDPNASPEAKAETKRSHEEAMGVLGKVIGDLDSSETEGKLPTPEMLRTYALVEVARVMDEVRDDVKHIKRMAGDLW